MIESIKREAEMLPDKSFGRIFVGGFSQGCMVSLATLLSFTAGQLGGVVGLSGMQALDVSDELRANTMVK